MGGDQHFFICKRRKFYENWVVPQMFCKRKKNNENWVSNTDSLHLLLKILPLVIAAAVKPHKLRVELVLPPAVG